MTIKLPYRRPSTSGTHMTMDANGRVRHPRHPRKAIRELWVCSRPAHRIIRKFKGTRRVAAALGLNPSSVTRWLYPAPLGTGGMIPAYILPRLLEAAKAAGVEITSADLDPRAHPDDPEMRALLS